MTRDWRNFFTPADFDRTPSALADAERANALLRRELQRAPRTYSEHEPRADDGEVYAPAGKEYSSAMVDVRLVRSR